ncbi:unnamed protein product [Gordionus sp. m RMFG-2023]|uniref:uncharacterized protein LOC135922461 n=1 Tax=Gordionus sp. m RMFG-2023 TaxID=3053472 RepID=UPI0030DF4C78
MDLNNICKFNIIDIANANNNKQYIAEIPKVDLSSKSQSPFVYSDTYASTFNDLNILGTESRNNYLLELDPKYKGNTLVKDINLYCHLCKSAIKNDLQFHLTSNLHTQNIKDILEDPLYKTLHSFSNNWEK